MPTNSEENPDIITRLEWSAEDNDFFSEDGKDNTDAGWDNNFDVDVDVDEKLDITQEGEEANDIDSPKIETPFAEDTAMNTINTANATENDISAASSPINSPKKSPSLAPSDSPPPSSDTKIIRNEEETSSTSMVDTISLPKGSEVRSTISGSTGNNSTENNFAPFPVHGTPSSQVGTNATTLVELEDEDEKFEEIVRKRNRVSQKLKCNSKISKL